MNEFQRRAQDELRRLLVDGQGAGAASNMPLVRFALRCDEPHRVIDNAISVMAVVDQAAMGDWPDDAKLAELLPPWFVQSCAPELSQDEAERWLAWWQSLSPAKQARVELEQRWSLSQWLYWMSPEQRVWYWWSAVVVGNHRGVVTIQVDEWPFPWGALRWLLVASGATAVEPDTSES
jgi:hypothetical protein